MAIELHVLAATRALETFRLSPGMHLLGNSAQADLLLSTRDAATDLCRVELGIDGAVRLRAIDEREIRGADGQTGSEVDLQNGDFALIDNLKLLRLDRGSRRDLQVTEAPALDETPPVLGVIPPSLPPLALRVRTGREERVVPVDRPMVTFGRDPANAIAFAEPEVSRRHARLILKPDGPWIEDLDSAQGTSLDGVSVTSAAWPLGGVVRLSRSPAAPSLELVPLSETLADAESDEALGALRGRSEGMRRVREQVLRYGKFDRPVLILGETGTGKELVARALARVRGAKKPFRPINCGAVPETLIESTLFGHQRGAFTSAVRDQPGEFEAAGDGTVFLDEVGEMPLGQQVKLLRVIESRELTRLGDTRTVPFRGQVVAATHRDLLELVGSGRFREDLYHRLAVVEIRVPPLRERMDDVPGLARAFLAERDGRSGGKTLSDAALEKLLAYRWPGNVRELRNVVDRAAVETDTWEIPAEAIQLRSVPPKAESAPAAFGIDSLPAHLDRIRHDWCERALQEAGGNVNAAAKALKMSGTTFRRLIARFGLAPDAGGPSEEAIER